MLKVGNKVKVKPLRWFEEYCYKKKLKFTSAIEVRNYYSYGICKLRNGGNLDIPGFVSDQTEYCNTIVTIEKIMYDKCYRIKEDGGRFLWSDYMFDIFPYLDYKLLINTFCNYQCINKKCEKGEYCELKNIDNEKLSKISTKKLNIGDHVTVKSEKWFSMYYDSIDNSIILPVENDNNRFHIPISMNEIIKFIRKDVTINKKIADGKIVTYYGIDGSNYVWPINSFDLDFSIDHPNRIYEYCKHCPVKNRTGDCNDHCILNISDEINIIK